MIDVIIAWKRTNIAKINGWLVKIIIYLEVSKVENKSVKISFE